MTALRRDILLGDDVTVYSVTRDAWAATSAGAPAG